MKDNAQIQEPVATATEAITTAPAKEASKLSNAGVIEKITNIVNANQIINELRTEKVGLISRLVTAEAEVQKHITATMEFSAKEEAFKTQLSEKEAEHNKQISQLQAALQEQVTQGQAKAERSIVSELQIPTPELPAGDSTSNNLDKSPEGLFGKFLALKVTNPGEATAFYRKHEKEIQSLLLRKK